jgi:hypothetical protein
VSDERREITATTRERPKLVDKEEPRNGVCLASNVKFGHSTALFSVIKS